MTDRPHRVTPSQSAAVALFLVFLSPIALADTTNLLPRFSELDALPPAWEPLEFPNIDRLTQYRLGEQDGQQVVIADTRNSASGLIARVRVNAGESLLLRWRWKVSNIYDKGDARAKAGDDYPARIYVAFEFEKDKAGFFERAKRRAAALVFGEELPGNALNYVWANRLPEGEIVANPYTDSTMMIAVESGSAKTGEWVSVERDIVADYRKAFGTEPPPVVGVAIMSDSDNTRESATAWYGDVELLKP